MKIDDALPTFILESRELLEEVESHLLSASSSEVDAETLNAIFRAAHTIKGSSGLFQLDHIVAFVHGVESLLDRARAGSVVLDAGVIALLLECVDHTRLLIDAVAAGNLSADRELERAGEPLRRRLAAYLGAALSETANHRPGPVESSSGTAAPGPREHWHISLRFGRDVLRNGMDPLSFIRYLGQIGTLSGVVVLSDLPAITEMDPESCYLGFELAFLSSATKEAIEGVFEYVKDDCQLHILPPSSRVTEYIALIETAPLEATRLGDMLVRCGSLTARELEEALEAQRRQPHDPPKLGEILVEQRLVHPAVIDAALVRQKQAGDAKLWESRSIRVDAGKLDRLIDLVGELIIATASTNLTGRQTHAVAQQEQMETLARLVEEVRESALQLRMVRIGGTFSRFQRVVHDVAREIGKDIRLIITGEDTELDKTVVERLGDPLTHLVRNAIDHGIEPSNERQARGKPAHGTVRLNAFHDSGSVVIEVSDDGGGMKRERIRAKAVERGLIGRDDVLRDDQILELVFEPGFSTADQVTNLSGRGVGMDVVKRSIEALRGTVQLTSEVGAGSTVTVRLPLTLAIVNGFLVGVADTVFVFPLDTIEECIEFPAATPHAYADLRGQMLPFVRLRELFEVDGPPATRENIVVVKHAGQKAGVVVDSLFGEFKTVIKPLGKMFSQVKWISGSSLLGTGEVALILDVPALVQQAN